MMGYVLEIVDKMDKEIVKLSTFHADDYLGPQSQKPDSNFQYVLNKTQGKYVVNELGPCMNPTGFVSNINCPLTDPYCNCPQKSLIPNKINPLTNKVEIIPEPTDEELIFLKKSCNECTLIDTVLNKSRWYGIDYSDQYCSYNCFNDTSGGSGPSGSSGSSYKGICMGGNTSSSPDGFGKPFPYVSRKTYTIIGASGGSEENGIIVTYWDGLTGISGGISSGISGDISGDISTGENFKDYMAYSRTNATFWNTPKETPLYRKAQTALLTYQRIKIVVNGDFAIKPGNLISIAIQTPEMSNISETRFSGRWMIYKNEHVITTQKHSMILYLMRDGNYHDPQTVADVDTIIEVSGVIGAGGKGAGE